MPTTVSSLVRQIKKPEGRLNILTFCFDEKLELPLIRTNHNIVAVTVPGHLYKWNKDIMAMPDNYTVISLDSRQDILSNMPPRFDFDAIVGYERPTHYEVARKLSDALQIPLIMASYQIPVSLSDAFNIGQYANMKGNVNVFGSHGIEKHWGLNTYNSDRSEYCVRSLAGVNTKKFTPVEADKRPNSILTVSHNFMQRSEETNFHLWRAIVEGFDHKMVGHNPGLSNNFVGYSLLHKTYQEAKVYLNTSIGGVFPVEICEAMASGCVVVTLPYPGVEEYVEDGVNGLIVKSVTEARSAIKLLFHEKKKFQQMSDAATEFARENLDIDKKSWEWTRIIISAIQHYREQQNETQPSTR